MSLFALLDGWRAPRPDPARIAWIGQGAFAHRGLHGPGIPENSLAAFEAAIGRGLGIECDVQRAGDGHAVVFHDRELDRLTGQKGPVARLSTEQLGRIALTGGEGTIPSLRQVLALVAGRVALLIEIKSRREDRISALCLAVRRVIEGYAGPLAVMSFDPRVSRWYYRHSPHTVRGLVVTEEGHRRGDSIRRRLALWHARPDFLAYDIRDLPSRFASAQRRRGLPVATWTVRNAQQREVCARHADAPIAEGDGVAPSAQVRDERG